MIGKVAFGVSRLGGGCMGCTGVHIACIPCWLKQRGDFWSQHPPPLQGAKMCKGVGVKDCTWAPLHVLVHVFVGLVIVRSTPDRSPVENDGLPYFRQEHVLSGQHLPCPANSSSTSPSFSFVPCSFAESAMEPPQEICRGNCCCGPLIPPATNTVSGFGTRVCERFALWATSLASLTHCPPISSVPTRLLVGRWRLRKTPVRKPGK